jgi:hypothetical protein
MLKPLRVTIPYAERLSFPSQWLRTRRDNQRFLCLIEVITFLHQHQRERGETSEGKPYVVATVADYRLAYELAREVLASQPYRLQLLLQGPARGHQPEQPPPAPLDARAG